MADGEGLCNWRKWAQNSGAGWGQEQKVDAGIGGDLGVPGGGHCAPGGPIGLLGPLVNGLHGAETMGATRPHFGGVLWPWPREPVAQSIHNPSTRGGAMAAGH